MQTFSISRTPEEKFDTVAWYAQFPSLSTTGLLQEFESHLAEPAAASIACLKAAGLQNIKREVMPNAVALLKYWGRSVQIPLLFQASMAAVKLPVKDTRITTFSCFVLNFY